jgi:hypothetical protein
MTSIGFLLFMHGLVLAGVAKVFANKKLSGISGIMSVIGAPLLIIGIARHLWVAMP